MPTIKHIIILSLIIFGTSCTSRTDNKSFVHDYPKYWDKYAKQTLVDTLFSDTLMIKANTEEGCRTAREFYINRTKELVADLQDDQNKIDSLYPMIGFDEVTLKRLPWNFKTALTNKQTKKLLEIINDPVSFDWAETTYESEYRVDFLKDHHVVASLTIDADKSVVQTEPKWPDFKKMKFGGLKSQPRMYLTKLIQEICQ